MEKLTKEQILEELDELCNDAEIKVYCCKCGKKAEFVFKKKLFCYECACKLISKIKQGK